MKILALDAENIKRLTAVHIQPDGNLVQITGKNGMGKSSVLDAIWWALEGTKHIQAQPIRKGAKKAHIRLDLGDLVVTRSFRRQEGGKHTTSITVENAEGARYPSPQKMLDDLVGALTFDPLLFARQNPKGQVETLKPLVTGFDFDAAATERTAAYDKRTETNRDLARTAAKLSELAAPPDEIPDTVDVDGLIDKLASASSHNAGIDAAVADNERARTSVHTKRNDAQAKTIEINTLKSQIQSLEDSAAALVAEAAAVEKRLDGAPTLPLKVDVEALRGAIEAGRLHNTDVLAAVRLSDERQTLTKEHDALREHSETLTTAIGDIDKAKQKAVADSDLPVEGIEFGDDEILFNGVPFEQASDAEKLRVSTQIAIAMNPQLRVIRIRDGSLLDSDAMELLATIADENDFQVWIERVDASGKVGFVLEDGHIKGQEPVEDEG